MTATYSLGPMPKWIIIDKDGLTAGGAYMYTYSSLNHSEPKYVYQTNGGTPYANPLIFDMDGTMGPIYWEYDPDFPDDLYYIEVYTGNKDAGGIYLYSIDDYKPPTGSGGGSVVSNYLPLVNYITNNQFIYHIDDMSAAANVTNTIIAPSNHKGFTPAPNSTTADNKVGTYGVLGPDIRFVKNNTMLATDQITFPQFAMADYPLTGDVTPVDYIRYQGSGSPTGEDYKCFQFPITQKVKNLSNTQLTVGFWAKYGSIASTIEVYIRQYFGSGTGASAEVRNLVASKTLTSSWFWYTETFTTPSVASKSLGTAGLTTNDDAFYIQLQMPRNTNSDVWFTKPVLLLGQINPLNEFVIYDDIDSIAQTPRTGDIRIGYSSVAPQGWIAMDDSTIGNAGSGATRANQDTFQLYCLLYNTVLDAWAPVSGGRTAPGNTMATAITDFLAGKTLTLPKVLGRALASAGAGSGLTSRALGENVGAETVTLDVSMIPAHTHGALSPSSQYLTAGGATVSSLEFGPDTPFSQEATTASTGGGGAHPNMQPTTFMNFYIKL